MVAGPIAKTLGLAPRGVDAVLKLLDDGNTVPFIARYRKEATGGLDEVAIGRVKAEAARRKALDERRAAILAAVESQGKLTDALKARLVAADDKATLEATYGWYGDQLGLLLAALDAIPEGDGTLLDHTLVVYGNVFGSGSTHGHTNKTYLLAGGGAGLVGGHLLDMGGAPHGELFTAILQGLGFDDESFGDPAFCSGPLAGVLS